MTKAEWMRIATELQARWPNREIPEESVVIWFDDLAQLPAEQVRAAIVALYRDGREWAPNGAQILGKVVELSQNQVDHGEAWKLAKQASMKADDEKAFGWLKEQSPAAAETVRRLCGGMTLTYLLADESTVRAQFRDIFRNIVEAERRDDLYAGIPNAGLRGLDRGPKRIGDVLKRALPAPADSGEAAA